MLGSKPGYQTNFDQLQLYERVKLSHDMLAPCKLCPHNCSINRFEKRGFCGSKLYAKVASYSPHFGEEEGLVGRHGSGTIFFSNCNLKCVFCQNFEISHYGEGDAVTEEELSNILIYLQNQGCHNINLVSPSHVVPQILEAVYQGKEQGLKLPLVYNSGGYDSKETLKLLKGIIDIYLPDVKFGSDEEGYHYSKANKYASTVNQALKEMFSQVGPIQTDEEGIIYRGVLVRHLVLPEDIDNSKEVLDMIADISTEITVNIMGQYFPEFQADKYSEMTGTPTHKDISYLKSYGKALGLHIM